MNDRTRAPLRPLLGAALLLVASAAMGHAQEIITHTADVTGEWVFIDFDAPEVEIEVADPVSSTAWDLGFLSTEVSVNGGASGPADVLAFCLCRNQYVGDDRLRSMTADSEFAAFEAVGADDIPEDPAAWTPGGIGDFPWYRYDMEQHVVWPTFDVYLVKRGDEVYKVQFLGFYDAEGNPRHLTFRYAKLTG